MCGIAGSFHPKGIDTQTRAHVERLRHRGPDSLHRVQRDHRIFMGTQRLAIVSRPEDQQPLEDTRGGWIVSLNGEIYNYKRLQREARANGFAPLDPSDTACIAALLCYLPVHDVLERLRGMFALALFHQSSQTLYLVRDRMGVKPLYWRYQNGQMDWGSELIALPGVELDSHAIQHFLLFEYIPAPMSIYKGIRKLRAGEMIICNAKGTKQSFWWNPPDISPHSDRDLQPWRKSFDFAFHNAVQIRIPESLPVVLQLSGGLDSTAVAKVAVQSKRECIGYTIQMGEKNADESHKAKTVAKRLKLKHKIIPFLESDFSAVARAALGHLSEPLADSSVLPYWKLMQSLSEDGIRCVISGDGADESLAGYPTYRVLPWTALAHKLKRPIHQLLHRLPVGSDSMGTVAMGKRFIEGLHKDWWKQQMFWMGAWLPTDLDGTIEEEVWSVASHWAKQAGTHPLARALYLDQRMYLAEGVITKVDRVSMAFGIEIRSPFLDHKLVELLASFPINSKMGRGSSKRILREYLSNDFPSEIIRQKKRGFGAPLGSWLRRFSFPKRNVERLEPWLKPDRLLQTIAEHQTGRFDHRRRIWSAYCLSEWLLQRGAH